MSEQKPFREYPKSMYRGEKDSKLAEHCVVHHERHEEEARAEGFVSGHEFFAVVEEPPKKRAKKAE